VGMAMLPVPIGMGVPVFVFFTTVARHGRNSTLQCADYAPKCVEGEFCDFAFTEFSEVRQDELEGMKHKKRTGVLVPALLVAFSKALALRVVGPYLAVDLLDQGLAVLVLLLELAHLLKLLGG
jgi:hypothetical protein